MAHKNSIAAPPKVKESWWGICHTYCLKSRGCVYGDKKCPQWERRRIKNLVLTFLLGKQTPARLIQRIIWWERCEQQEEQAAAVLVLCNSLAEERNLSRLVSSLISFVIQVNGKHSTAIRKRSWFRMFKNREWKWKGVRVLTQNECTKFIYVICTASLLQQSISSTCGDHHPSGLQTPV